MSDLLIAEALEKTAWAHSARKLIEGLISSAAITGANLRPNERTK